MRALPPAKCDTSAGREEVVLGMFAPGRKRRSGDRFFEGRFEPASKISRYHVRCWRPFKVGSEISKPVGVHDATRVGDRDPFASGPGDREISTLGDVAVFRDQNDLACVSIALEQLSRAVG